MVRMDEVSAFPRRAPIAPVASHMSAQSRLSRMHSRNPLSSSSSRQAPAQAKHVSAQSKHFSIQRASASFSAPCSFGRAAIIDCRCTGSLLRLVPATARPEASGSRRVLWLAFALGCGKTAKLLFAHRVDHRSRCAFELGLFLFAALRRKCGAGGHLLGLGFRRHDRHPLFTRRIRVITRKDQESCLQLRLNSRIIELVRQRSQDEAFIASVPTLAKRRSRGRPCARQRSR
ncbi:hypothetical protein MCBRY_001179 [Methylocystis bryophila]